jgi:hypothetical protein
MIINDKTLGKCEVEIEYARSTVDCYIGRGYSLTFDRELTDIELDYLQDHYSGDIQEHAWESGNCRDHN